MFYSDAQALVIHISRGTCTRGDIVIHISFALAQHISQRVLKQVVLIVAYLQSVVLELYESPHDFVLSHYIFVFVLRLNATSFFCRLYNKIIKSNVFVV